MTADAPMPRAAFIERLRTEGGTRYHDEHPLHIAMHAGTLTRDQLQAWVRNRYYYQTRVPIKDALILSKSEDPVFRRAWIRRLVDHDGAADHEGGLDLWLRLAEGVGLNRDEVASCRGVLPGVRYACDAYVELVRQRSLLEAVASSLTELFVPDLMGTRIAAWERHYRWVDRQALAYFRSRISCATRDSQEAIELVVAQAQTRRQQNLCVAALIDKTRVLWHLLDCVALAHGPLPQAPRLPP